jgi:hypothetical protein
MMTTDETKTTAGSSPVERQVRAHDPERVRFEAWARQGPRDLARSESGAYINNLTSFAWLAWQAARPPRHEIGRLVNLAADCAQRKPLRSLEPLTESILIGHRQFARAYNGADEAVRLLAIELRRVADAL